MCNPECKRIALPIGDTEIKKLMEKLGAGSHLWRRLMALNFRKLMEQDPHRLCPDKVRWFLGWSRDTRLAEYSVDLRAFDAFELPFTIGGAVKCLERGGGKAAKRLPVKWLDVAAEIGKSRVTLKRTTVEGISAKPNRALRVGNSAFGGAASNPSFVTVDKRIFQPGSKKSGANMTIRAPPAAPAQGSSAAGEETGGAAGTKMEPSRRHSVKARPPTPDLDDVFGYAGMEDPAQDTLFPPAPKPSPPDGAEGGGFFYHNAVLLPTDAVILAPQKRPPSPAIAKASPGPVRKRSKERAGEQSLEISFDDSTTREAVRTTMRTYGFTIVNGWAVGCRDEDDGRKFEIRATCNRCKQQHGTKCGVVARATIVKGVLSTSFRLASIAHTNDVAACFPPLGDNSNMTENGNQKWAPNRDKGNTGKFKRSKKK